MQKSIWVFIIFIIVITIIILGYLSVAIFKYYGYNRLKAETSAVNISFSVTPLNDEKFFLKGNYQYRVKDVLYSGETTFSTAYRNPYAAEEAMKEISKNYRTVWYDPNQPSFSSLEKIYPTKQIVYAFILFALWNYFIWGGYFYTKALLKKP